MKMKNNWFIELASRILEMIFASKLLSLYFILKKRHCKSNSQMIPYNRKKKRFCFRFGNFKYKSKTKESHTFASDASFEVSDRSVDLQRFKRYNLVSTEGTNNEALITGSRCH